MEVIPDFMYCHVSFLEVNFRFFFYHSTLLPRITTLPNILMQTCPFRARKYYLISPFLCGYFAAGVGNKCVGGVGTLALARDLVYKAAQELLVLQSDKLWVELQDEVQ